MTLLGDTCRDSRIRKGRISDKAELETEVLQLDRAERAELDRAEIERTGLENAESCSMVTLLR